MVISEKLRALREKRGETQEEAAEGCGVSRVAYARYEAGLRFPAGRLLTQIADHFGVTVEYLTNDAIPIKKEPAATIDVNGDGVPDTVLADADQDDAFRAMVAKRLSSMDLEQLQKVKSFVEFLLQEGDK